MNSDNIYPGEQHQFKDFECMDKRVILHLISAHGFGLVKGFIEVHAKLMSKNLKSPIIPVNNNVLKIATEIVWYMDNSTLKKLRMSNASIKVECFRIPTNESTSNEKLGYLLLSIKEAQTINAKSNDRIENKPYKLIGSKNCNYDLTISLRIEDNIKVIETSPKKIKISKVANINDNSHHLQKDIKNNNLPIDKDIDFEKSDNIDSLKNDIYVLENTENLPHLNEIQNLEMFDEQQKAIEELEDWKEKQKILFNEKMKIKKEKMFEEFNNKWLADRKRIEEDLSYEVSRCKLMTERVDKFADMLKEREAIIMAKELEFASETNCMENKYITLIQNSQSTNAQTFNELGNKIVELESKLNDSEKSNFLLKREIEQLKDDINTNSSFRIQQLEQTILNLESKCEEAEKSSLFYKERWIASVRRINQICTKLYGNQNEQFLNNKQNIQNVLTKQSEERKHDEEKLKKLLIDLGKLRQDMTNINYLDS